MNVKTIQANITFTLEQHVNTDEVLAHIRNAIEDIGEDYDMIHADLDLTSERLHKIDID